MIIGEVAWRGEKKEFQILGLHEDRVFFLSNRVDISEIIADSSLKN